MFGYVQCFSVAIHPALPNCVRRSCGGFLSGDRATLTPPPPPDLPVLYAACCRYFVNCTLCLANSWRTHRASWHDPSRNGKNTSSNQKRSDSITCGCSTAMIAVHGSTADTTVGLWKHTVSVLRRSMSHVLLCRTECTRGRVMRQQCHSWMSHAEVGTLDRIPLVCGLTVCVCCICVGAWWQRLYVLQCQERVVWTPTGYLVSGIWTRYHYTKKLPPLCIRVCVSRRSWSCDAESLERLLNSMYNLMNYQEERIDATCDSVLRMCEVYVNVILYGN